MPEVTSILVILVRSNGVYNGQGVNGEDISGIRQHILGISYVENLLCVF